MSDAAELSGIRIQHERAVQELLAVNTKVLERLFAVEAKQREQDKLTGISEYIPQILSELVCIKEAILSLAKREIESKDKSHQDMGNSNGKVPESKEKGTQNVGTSTSGSHTSKQVIANKATLATFNTKIQKQVADLFKDKDPKYNKLFTDLLARINEGWSDRVNSEEDITPEIGAVTAVLINDIKNVAFSQRKTGPDAIFTAFVNVHLYIPQKTGNHVDTAHTNGSQSQAPYSATTKSVPVFYDIDEKEVEGLVEYVAQAFPQAQRYDPRNIKTPFVLLTFIIIHDRLDMNKWTPICEKRSGIAANHFVILVCNKTGDATRADIPVDKLQSSAIFKAEFTTELERGTNNSIKQRQKLDKSSLDAAFATIIQML